jgi:hypothetical protein
MKTQSVLAAVLAAAPSAFAHTVWTNFYVDGISQVRNILTKPTSSLIDNIKGDGVAMRMRKDPQTASFPLEDYASNNMACSQYPFAIMFLVFDLLIL